MWPDAALRDGNPDRIGIAELKFPVVPKTYKSTGSSLFWRGAPVMQLSSLSLKSGSYDEVMFWRGSNVGPTALGLMEVDGDHELVPVWEDFDKSRAPSLPYVGYQCRFPPEWKNLVGATLDNLVAGGIWIWNPEHPLVQALDSDSWEWTRKTFADNEDPVPHADELFSRPGRIAGWIMRCLRLRERLLWSGLVEREAEFLPRAWQALFGSESELSLVFRRESYFEESTDILSPTEWQHVPDARDGAFTERMGSPGEDWQLSLEAEPTD